MGLYRRLSVEGGAATERRRSRDLDAVRAIAVLMVVAGHAYLLGGVAPPHTSHAVKDALVNAGGHGIWLFFALSGYLIAAPVLRALQAGEHHEHREGAHRVELRRPALPRRAAVDGHGLVDAHPRRV